MLRKIRILLAAVFFIGITLLFVDFSGTLHHYVAWMPKLQLLEAVLATNVIAIAIVVVLTLVFGRIYCSVICPLGVMQDIFGWTGKKMKKNRYSFSKAVTWLRYSALGVFVAACAAGVGSLTALLAPYSAFGRIATNLLQPVWQYGNNLLAILAENMDSFAFYHSNIWMRSLPSLIIAAVTLVVLAVLAYRNGRTYCNTICPVGTVLGFLSRFSFLKVHFDTEKCRNCSMCTKNCKASCIDFKNHSVDYSRCVACGDCLKSCKFGALHYHHAQLHQQHAQPHQQNAQPHQQHAQPHQQNTQPHQQNAQPHQQNTTADLSKRSFLIASTLLASGVWAQDKKKVDGGLAAIEDKVAPKRQTKLTPPGSVSAKNMEHRCTGCQLCVSECPNEVLRPSSDLWHLMQPEMSYERGYCRPECNRCSQVCPAGAIKPLRHEDKASTQIGHAVWIKKNCVPLTDGVECGNCARHCPAGAIEMVPSDPDDESSAAVPAVNEARCIGCGACEYVCPARPFSAIYVEGNEVHKEL